MKNAKGRIIALMLTVLMITGSLSAAVFADGASIPATYAGIILCSETTNPDFINNLDKYDVENELIVKSADGNQDISKVAIQAPVFIKFNFASVVDPDGDGVVDYDVTKAFVFIQAPATEMPIDLYSVPGNDISLESMRRDTNADGEPDKLVCPEISAKLGGSGTGNSGRTRLATETAAGTFGGADLQQMSATYNILTPAKNALNSEQTSLSLMVYTYWAQTTQHIGSGDESRKPRLYLQLTKKIKKPVSSFVECGGQTFAIEKPRVAVQATDETGIQKVEIYLNNVLKQTLTEATDDVYTAAFTGLSAGSYNVKAVVTANSGGMTELTSTMNVLSFSENVNNIARAIVSDYSSTVTVTPNATNTQTFNSYNTSGNKQTWYFQYDISDLRENVDRIQKISLQLNVGTANALPLRMVEVRTNHQLSASSAYADVSDFNNRLAKLLAGYTVGTINADITDELLVRLNDPDYGSLYTVQLSAQWGGMAEGVAPAFLNVEYNPTAPAFVTDNGNSTLTVAAKPVDYTTAAENETIDVIVASYNSDNSLNSVNIRTLPVNDRYVTYDVALTAAKYKVFVFDDIGTLKPLLRIPATNITE